MNIIVLWEKMLEKASGEVLRRNLDFNHREGKGNIWRSMTLREVIRKKVRVQGMEKPPFYNQSLGLTVHTA